jgi:hypothetical protein
MDQAEGPRSGDESSLMFEQYDCYGYDPYTGELVQPLPNLLKATKDENCKTCVFLVRGWCEKHDLLGKSSNKCQDFVLTDAD